MDFSVDGISKPERNRSYSRAKMSSSGRAARTDAPVPPGAGAGAHAVPSRESAPFPADTVSFAALHFPGEERTAITAIRG